MKKTMACFRNRFLLLALALLPAIYSFAQDDQSGSIYDVKQSRHHLEMYSGFFPYVVFGVVVALLGYVSYRYWHDNQTDDHTGHEPHHQ
jgi:hypothetical protein